MSFLDDYNKMANQQAMEILSSLMLKEKIQLEKHGFVPYEKGDYIYTAEINEGLERLTVEIRRDEVVGIWHMKQTRCIHLGELVTIGYFGEERQVPIRNAYQNLDALLNSMAHMFSKSILQYIYISIKSNPAFEKIGTFRLCVEIDPRTGEREVSE